MEAKKPRILHLEDEPGWSRKVKQYLRENYEITATPSLSRAEELLNAEDFHLIIADISLVPYEGNDTGGFQFLSWLRSSDLWRDLPVIVLTGYPEKERMREAFKEFRVFDFLEKNALEREDLQTTVTQAIATGPNGRDLIREIPKVLIIEDEPQWQTRIAKILEGEGCEVDIASTYIEAIDKLTDEVYHLATVDIRLSDMDPDDIRGAELVDIVRRLRQSVDIIFISAYGNPTQIRQAAFDLGARDFIDKGDFRPQHLRLRVRDILRRLIYVNIVLDANIDTNTNTPVLKFGEQHLLTAQVSKTRPQGVETRSFTRPVTTGRFEMEVEVQPWDVDVLPGSLQILTVMPDDSSEPISFTIIPTVIGRIELVVEFRYQRDYPLLTRIVMVGEVVK